MDEDNISFGWNVSSDLSLDVIGDESQIFLTCQAVSRDHQGQVMTAKAELEVLVLSELLLLLSREAIYDDIPCPISFKFRAYLYH